MQLYLNIARTLVFKALKKYKPGISSFTTYLMCWLRSLNKEFTLNNVIMRSGGSVINPLSEDKIDDIINSEQEHSLIEDLEKFLNEKELSFLVLREQGFTRGTIVKRLDITIWEYYKIKESTALKYTNYLKENI